jgi:hypothetical protein
MSKKLANNKPRGNNNTGNALRDDDSESDRNSVSSVNSIDLHAIADITLRSMDREYQSTVVARRSEPAPTMEDHVVEGSSNFHIPDEDMSMSILGSGMNSSSSSASAAFAAARNYSRRAGTVDDPLSSDDEVEMDTRNGDVVHERDNSCNEYTDHEYNNSSSDNENAESEYVALEDNPDDEEFTGFMSAEDFPSEEAVAVTGIFRSQPGAEEGVDATSGQEDWAAFDSVAAAEAATKANGKIPIRVSIPPLSEGILFARNLFGCVMIKSHPSVCRQD